METTNLILVTNSPERMRVFFEGSAAYERAFGNLVWRWEKRNGVG
ncbi:MAG TPA: hypothetical protein VEC99_09250 [Clostridia bacterium]|nr:hypothetical protein [Clostridia bacterium]